MIKIVFFDIDGTLVDDENQIPHSARRALEALKRQGILTGICTGRCPSELRQFHQSHPELHFDVEVYANGALVRQGERLLAKHPLPKAELSRLIEVFRRHNLPYWLSDEEEWFFSIPDLTPVAHVLVSDELARTDFYDPDHHLTHDIYMGEVFLEPQTLQTYSFDLQELEMVPGMLVGGSFGPMVDFWSKSVSKATGVEECLRALGLRRVEMMAFGDSFNDVPILQLAGLGVAMGNGTSVAKKAADFVTRDLAADGIEYALRHFGLLPEKEPKGSSGA